MPMSTTIKLRPGQKGTKSLVAKRGAALLCVRYRYDKVNRTRLKTVELIIERKPWAPAAHRFEDNVRVPVRIAYNDTALREKAKAARGKWDPKTRAWLIQYGKIKGTELERRIIPADRE